MIIYIRCTALSQYLLFTSLLFLPIFTTNISDFHGIIFDNDLLRTEELRYSHIHSFSVFTCIHMYSPCLPFTSIEGFMTDKFKLVFFVSVP